MLVAVAPGAAVVWVNPQLKGLWAAGFSEFFRVRVGILVLGVVLRREILLSVGLGCRLEGIAGGEAVCGPRFGFDCGFILGRKTLRRLCEVQPRRR